MAAQATSARTQTQGTPARGASPRPPRRQRDPERKERILVAAAALGAQRGFDAISMADIGAEAGIVGSGVYRHFDSKTAILVAMADRVMDRLMTRAAEIIAASTGERECLSRLVRDHIEVALTHRDALAVYHREVRTLPADERRRLSRSTSRSGYTCWRRCGPTWPTGRCAWPCTRRSARSSRRCSSAAGYPVTGSPSFSW
jgi:AcrR family transcriptional regulator